jgi:cell division transport system permease protein
MSRFRLVVSESWNSITANVSTTFAATMTVLIGMFLLGLFIALGTWVLSWSHHVKSELLVKDYFAQDATQREEQATMLRIRSDPRVKTVVFVSKAKALKQMQVRLPGVVGALPSNPLPDTAVVTPKKGEYSEALYRDLNRTKPEWVDHASWGGTTAKRVLTVAKVISLVFLIAVILLVAASTLLIANTIRLSIFSRRREIEVMKLVGATNWFVRGPFMLEGLICGLVGSLAAVVLLGVGKAIALPSILPHLHDTSGVHALPFALNAVALLSAGLLLGAAGSGLTLHRFLKV